MKLKLTKRPTTTARVYGDALTEIFPSDFAGMSVLAMIGKWAADRNALHLQPLQKRKKLRIEMRHILGITMAAILALASRRGVVITFNTMDAFIMVEKKMGTLEVDWALGLFCSTFSKWCTQVTCYKDPEEGLEQLLLQQMLNHVGLMIFLSKRDPIVDCFLPVYENLVTVTKKKK